MQRVSTPEPDLQVDTSSVKSLPTEVQWNGPPFEFTQLQGLVYGLPSCRAQGYSPQDG